MDARILVVQDLPPFTVDGVLPPADYAITLARLRESTLVKGPADRAAYPNWDIRFRRRLVDNLSTMVKQLWHVGIEQIYVDGSFVEDKDHPNDIDGYFECERDSLRSGRLERELNLLDRDSIWTWAPEARRPALGFGKRQLPMWHKYRVELYPHVGQTTGIRDRFGNELAFPAAFRLTRSGIPKGILKIIPDDPQRN